MERRAPLIAMCRSGFPSAWCQRACTISRIRLWGRINTHISGRPAMSGRPGPHRTIHVLQFACHCKAALWSPSCAICAFFSEGILDVDTACRRKGHHFPFPCFHDTSSYRRCASLPGSSTTPQRIRYQGQPKELSSCRVCGRVLGGSCPD